MIATIRILNMYYYIVLKWSNVRVSVLEKKIENGTKFGTDTVLIKMSE